MYLCYVDESGDTGPRGSKHLLLGAAALFEGRWSYVSNDFSKVIGQYFPAPPRPKEIHCTDVRGGRGAYATLSRDQRMDLLADVCRVVTGMIDTEIRLFTVIIEKSSWFARYPGRSHHEMYVDAFEELVSRFDLYLRRRNAEGQPSKGLMIS